ncbi:MAG: glycosyltransferase family 39 protein [Candidatus Altiarchaeota archaeon]|nr:glycosyltransferase family 39 protein [Candidatus Altiarchaeota archaeon]
MANTVDRLLGIVKSAEFTLLIAAFMVYMSNPGVLLHTDVTTTRLLPLSIIRERDFDLDEFTFLYENKSELPYYLKNIEGRIVSTYPVFTPLLATPVYLLPALTGLDIQSDNVILLAKISAALMTAISCLFIYWTVKRCASEKTALLVTAVYAFGTSNWTISSQDLWQHGPGELFIAMSIYLLIRGLKEEKCIRYAGLALSTAVAIRPTNAIIALVLSAYVLMEHRRQFPRYILYAAPMALAVLVYSQTYLHSMMLMGQVYNPTERWDNPLVDGLAGLLMSPAVGLLVYSPIFLVSLIGALKPWQGERNALNTQLRYYTLATAVFILMWGKWRYWHGCHVYGPRMLIEILPFLCLFLARPADEMLKNRRLAVLLLALAGISVLAHFAQLADLGGIFNENPIAANALICNGDVYNQEAWWDAKNTVYARYADKVIALFN